MEISVSKSCEIIESLDEWNWFCLLAMCMRLMPEMSMHYILDHEKYKEFYEVWNKALSSFISKLKSPAGGYVRGCTSSLNNCIYDMYKENSEGMLIDYLIKAEIISINDVVNAGPAVLIFFLHSEYKCLCLCNNSWCLTIVVIYFQKTKQAFLCFIGKELLKQPLQQQCSPF